MSFPQEYHVTITASEDLNLPQRSGSFKQHTAASRVPHIVETRFIRDYPHESVEQIVILFQVVLASRRMSADMDRETVVPPRLLEIKCQRECKHWETEKISTKSMNGKLHWPCGEKNWLSKEWHEAEADVEVKHWGNEKLGCCSCMRSIRSSSPNDYSYNRRINGLIRLKETTWGLCGELEMRNRLFREYQAKECQEIEETSASETSKNWWVVYASRENWDHNAPSKSPRGPGTKSKFGKERVHREILSKSVNLMSVVLARPNSGKDHMRRLCNKKDAPAE